MYAYYTIIIYYCIVHHTPHYRVHRVQVSVVRVRAATKETNITDTYSCNTVVRDSSRGKLLLRVLRIHARAHTAAHAPPVRLAYPRARTSPTINHSDDTTNDNNRKDDDYNNNSCVSSGICCDEALETHNACRPLCKWTNAGRRYYKILCYPCPNSTTASFSRSSAADVVPTAVFVIAVQSEPDARFAYFGRRSTFFTVSPSCQRILEPSLHNNVITFPIATIRYLEPRT